MNDPLLDGWAERLTQTARALPYPPTPHLATGVSQRLAHRPAPTVLRRWQVALLALALIALGLLAVPAVRAGVARFIQIGVVRIFVGPATPAPIGHATGLPLTATPTPAGPRPLTATPRASATPLPSLLDLLIGETTLADAKAKAGFTVGLPSYPADLGLPDRVFLQGDGAPMVVLVWVDQAHPDQARLALFEITPGNIGIQKSEFTKGVPSNLQNTTVHGQPAAWTTGPYLLELKDGNLDFSRLIEGHVLIWVENGITYRLEMRNAATMAEAVQIAESLR
jgi:hypothetical protein